MSVTTWPSFDQWTNTIFPEGETITRMYWNMNSSQLTKCKFVLFGWCGKKISRDIIPRIAGWKRNVSKCLFCSTRWRNHFAYILCFFNDVSKSHLLISLASSVLQRMIKQFRPSTNICQTIIQNICFIIFEYAHCKKKMLRNS